MPLSWFNPLWTNRLPVTVDNTANASSALSYYQAAVSLTGAAYTAFHAIANSDGSDIRVTDSDGVTPLSFALEGIDTANSAVYLLVKVPAVAAGDTRIIYVYYGNPAAATSISSYATTVGPTTALTGPTDVYTQTDMANFNANPLLLLLKHQGGIHGGGASLNGKILCYMLAGANSNSDRTNGSIALMSSTDGGVTFGGKSVILAHDSNRMVEPRAVGELADGTILLCYSCDTFSLSSAGKAKAYIAKSTDGGATWSNLSTTPSNAITCPWGTYGTDHGAPYNALIEKVAGGDLFLSAYGTLAGTSNWSFYFLKCPAGSDPTNGTTWVTQGSLLYTSGLGHGEPSVLQVTSTHYLAFFRSDTSGVARDLHMSSSSDSGVTWSAGTALSLPGADLTNVGAVSPWAMSLASGNYLLTWGVRYGTSYGAGAAVSTDGGTTWLDRAPTLFAGNVGQTTGDGGYPSAVQNADGTICVVYYREVGGNVATCNVVRVVCTEDYICNANNIYDGCESFGSLWTHGANATVSATHTHNGSNAFKIDNSAGTGGAGDWGLVNIWGTNPATKNKQIAFSYWSYETANDTSRGPIVKDSTGVFSNSVGNRSRVQIVGSNSDHIEWYDGASLHDTGTAAPANEWAKITDKAAVLASSVTGEILLNNVSLTTSQGQEASGGNPQMLLFQGGSVASTHNVIFWVDDLFTHQYTANTPAITVGSQGDNIATTYTLTPPSPASGYANNASGLFTVTPNALFTGTVTITPSGGGLSTPIVLTWGASSAARTFAITPTEAGTVTLTPSSGSALTDPSPITYTAIAQTLSVGPLVLTVLSPQTVTFVGTGTRWQSNPPTFTVVGPGSAGTTIGTATALTDTSATALVSPGSSPGSILITDSTTRATATATVMPVPVSAITGWSYLSSVSSFASGLLSSVGYTVLHSDGSVQSARSQSGVFAVGSIGYAAPVALPLSGAYVILWDDGAGHQSLQVVSPRGVEPPSAGAPAGLSVEQCLADLHATLAGRSSGFVLGAGGSPVFTAPDGTTPRVSGTVDAAGNRSAVTISPPQ